jgi:peptidyl-prolyl cis-trans isomerase D
MLELLRRKAQSPYLQATIVIIILVFIFWGVGTSQRGDRDMAAAVNGQTITIREYQQAYDRLVNQYREQFGGQLPPQLFAALGIKEMALDQLIDQQLIRQGAREMGVTVSEDEVRRTIEEMEVFRTGGQYDFDRYKEVLSASRMAAGDFEEGIRTDLLLKRVMKLLGEFGRVSEREIEDRFQYEYGEVKFNYLALPAENFVDGVEVADERLTAFFEKNGSRYQTQPQVKVKYISFPFTQAWLVAVTPEEIEAYYQENQEQFQDPERRRARHILIRTPEDASPEVLAAKRQQIEDILAQAREGEDFAKLAAQHSEDGSASDGGDLGFFGRGQMVQPFEEAAFRMAEGETSNVVTTRFGFHIIKLEQILPARTKSLPEVSAGIADTLRRQGVKTSALKKANTAYEQIILAGSLEKYATQTGMPLQETGYFDRLNPPAEFAEDRGLLEAAFNLRAGELSSLIAGEKGYAIIFLEDEKGPEIPPLADIRQQVEKDFIEERSLNLAEETARKLLAEVTEGADLAGTAEKLDLQVQETGFLTRRQMEDRGLPSSVLQEGLTLTESKPWPEDVSASDRTYYVLGFKERRQAPDELFAAKKEEIRQTLLQQDQMVLLSAWVENLKQKAKISRNERLLQQ